MTEKEYKRNYWWFAILSIISALVLDHLNPIKWLMLVALVGCIVGLTINYFTYIWSEDVQETSEES